MPLIHISYATYERLKKLARDNGDTPAKVREVIELLVLEAKWDETPSPPLQESEDNLD